MKWTPQEEAVLRKCSEKGLTFNETLKVLPARTRDSLANKANSMRLKFPATKPAVIDADAYHALTGEVLDI